ncbi:hypothetical protein [Labilibaculum antarcticum]|uniref:Uncharacterized protein n=1 Tax=Labilibaculum antarcticum TaxID=1717717 RepID=A0A1Y1CI86_9BACT|nr:hypothetical protein [Labilibaculum antarcticum]BAX80089.1 hypothetical protein ALGA_1715 [Labilibaculum antarcticum]
MELTSITQIRELKNTLKEQIAKIDKSVHKDSMFGKESEYSYRGLLGGLDCLLTDLTTLTKAPNQFLKLSTYQERQNILSSLKNVQSYINSPTQFWQYLDNLKVAIRPFHVRYTQQRLLDFDEELSKVIVHKQTLESEIEQFKETKSKNEELLSSLTEKNEELSVLLENLNEKIIDTDDKNSVILDQISTLSAKVSKGDELIATATQIVETTEEQLEEAKGSRAKIQKFEDRVEKRQEQLDSIYDKTEEYRQHINDFEKEREDLNQKAKNTIIEAQKALQYNTARGLSASFQAQLDKIEKSKYDRWLWGAAIFLALTLGIGVWIVLSGHNDITATIGRVVLTSFTITGAIFCANQFIRQKNVIEDYSYKLVLAKSIVGFSEQLNNGQSNSDEYKAYIQLALSEIHQDPLRKRSKNEKDVDGGVKSGVEMVLDVTQKIIGLTKK